jgi:hypothetical protein
MRHPLQLKLAALRRRAHRLLLLFGIARVVAIALAVATTLAAADWLIRYSDPGIRLISSVTALLALGWVLYRFLWPVLTSHLSDVNVALRIERCYPQLEDRLSSTAQFLEQSENDPLAGSPALRRAVVTQSEIALENLDLNRVLDRRQPMQALAWAALVCCITAGLILLDPSSARIAAARITNPFNRLPWPQENHLEIRDAVHRIGLGQTVEIEVIDSHGAPLPEEVTLEIRYRDDLDGTTENDSMQLMGDSFVARREDVTRPFFYRAVGGDDFSMPWIELEVVEPPEVEAFTVKLHYPEYTSWPAAEVDKHIRAIKGTRVELSGSATKPLASARLIHDKDVAIPLALSEDGYSFSLAPDEESSFVIEKSGSYWFELLERTSRDNDEEPLLGGIGTRYEVRMIEDSPPTVSVEEPEANTFVTPDAAVVLEFSAKDDLALWDVMLQYARSDESEAGEFTIPLYEGPDQVEIAAGETHPATRVSGDSRPLTHVWELSKLDLKPGAQITFQAVARDYLPQEGRSASRRLTIITGEELQDRLVERQSFILGELARILEMQRKSRAQTAALEIQLNEVGELNKQQIDDMQGVELGQRQIERGLSGEGEGVRSQIQSLLAELKSNQVDSPDVQRRMHQLLDGIDEIAEQPLPGVRRGITDALKGAQAALDRRNRDEETTASSVPEGVRKSLEDAGQNQDTVIQSLEQMLAELSQWDSYRRFFRDVAALRRQQEELGEQTVRLGRETISRNMDELTPQQTADLKKTAQAEEDLAREFDRMQQRMGALRDELEKSDPLVAGTIDDALHQSRQQGISDVMRQSAEHLKKNQVGQTTQKQQQVSKSLEEMLDILANRRVYELEQLVKKLKEAETAMQALREKQEGLRKKMKEAQENKDPQLREQELQRLTREQRELERETQRMARKLQRLQADRASRATAQAGGKMGQSAQQGEENNAEGADDAARQAQSDLDEAQQQLAERRQEAEADLAFEQLARLQDSLKSLKERQGTVLTETQRLDALRQTTGRLSRGQSASVRTLAGDQRNLSGEVNSLAKKLSAAAAFELVMNQAAARMIRAAESLDQRDIGDTTQDAQQDALTRLRQLLDAMAPEKAEPGEEGSQGGGQGGGQQPPSDGIQDVAQLKLIKLLQQEINQRTDELKQRFADLGRLSPEQQEQFSLLSREQSDLADLVRNMITAAEADPEDDPEALPDLDPLEGDPLDGDPLENDLPAGDPLERALDSLPELDALEGDPLEEEARR